MLDSRSPLIIVETLEEQRLLRICLQISMKSIRPFYRWSITEGVRPLGIDVEADADTMDPASILRHIKLSAQAGVYILLDFHPYLTDAVHVRLIKEIAQQRESMNKTLLFVSHAFPIPAEVKHFCATFELILPNQAQIKNIINEEIKAWSQRNQGARLKADRDALDKLANNLGGISVTHVRRLVRHAIEDDNAITHSDLPELMRAKHMLMSHDGIIHFEYDTARFADVAGLATLKAWLEKRKPALLGKSSRIDQPKGIMLLGVQGCGKSLVAKAVAGQFGLPLLRLDFASLYGKYYGETEKNLAQALQVAEVMAPCVLWMDELEKGIAPSGTDEGLSRRVLGSLLSWMAERKSPVFVVATSNDITQLPPELVRKGRLDEIFFVDLPDEDNRRRIFSIHLRQRNLAPGGFGLQQLAQHSEGFSGSEIEQLVVSGLYAGAAGQLDTAILLAEIERTRPLSVVMQEQIASLRQWAASRTVTAH
ncbi:MAG: AAA family ATPase [gamma proteobacterium symbiont of Bathyaustriella thionipta]|nr:AAA family ATPase [gamma proteobacterium symbiont of Bathyaustriella thionipta]